MEEIYEAARWPVGPFRFAPWLGVRNAGFVRGNPEVMGAEEDDFTITVGAGLRTYARSGKMLFALHMLPEYVWWEENEAKRRTNGRFGAGAFGYFNRLRVEASARRLEEQGFFSSEVQELTTSQRDVLRLATELELGSRILLVGRARFEEFRNQEEETARFSQLDRDEDSLLLGARYYTPGGLTLGLGYEDLATEFVRQDFDRSSSGDAVHFWLGYEGPKFEARLDLAETSLDPEPGSSFTGFEDTTGELQVFVEWSRRLNFLTWARRDLYYSVRAGSSHFLGERYGALLELSGRRLRLGVFAAVGEDDFEAIDPMDPDRVDDVSEIGASATLELRESIGVVLSATRTEYDSNIDFFDRDITTLALRLEIGGLLRKLSLGSPPGEW
jgi:hypothetical protein